MTQLRTTTVPFGPVPFFRPPFSADYPTARYEYMNWPEQRYPSAVVVTYVVPQSSAADAQLQEGDFITHIEQQPIHTPDEFHAAVHKLDKPSVIVRTIDDRRLPLKR